MALTRKQLKAMGLTDEQVDSIIEAHTETVDGLKDELKTAKESADKLNSVQKELDDLKAAGDGGWEEKAKEFEKKYNDLVTENQNRATHSAKEAAYRELLKTAGISEKRLDAILKVSDIDGMIELENGKIKDADKLTESVKTEWADFITTSTTTGANTKTPPETGAGKRYTAAELRNMTAEEINKNWDSVKASLQTTGGN
jgi:hypothetical protein